MEMKCEAHDCDNNVFYKSVIDGQDALVCTECKHAREDIRKKEPPMSEGSDVAAGSIAVPVEELRKLEEARKALYDHLGGHTDAATLHGLTQQIWKVANTKKWE